MTTTGSVVATTMSTSPIVSENRRIEPQGTASTTPGRSPSRADLLRRLLAHPRQLAQPLGVQGLLEAVDVDHAQPVAQHLQGLRSETGDAGQFDEPRRVLGAQLLELADRARRVELEDLLGD